MDEKDMSQFEKALLSLITAMVIVIAYGLGLIIGSEAEREAQAESCQSVGVIIYEHKLYQCRPIPNIVYQPFGMTK